MFAGTKLPIIHEKYKKNNNFNCKINTIYTLGQVNRNANASRIVHIFAIKSHDIIKHALGLDSRAVRVKRNSLDIVVDGFVPLATLTGLIA